MVRQERTKRRRRALIEKESHLRNLQRARGVLEHHPNLLGSHPWKPSNEVSGGGAVFKVLKKGLNRSAGATKHPGATNVAGITFNRRA